MDQLHNKIGSSVRDDANLRRQLEIAQLEKEDIKKKLNGQIDSMRRLRNSAIEGMEDKLQGALLTSDAYTKRSSHFKPLSVNATKRA